MEWVLPQGDLPSNRQIHAQYTPNLYQVTFISDREIEGWEKFGEEYRYITEMRYDSEIEIYLGHDLLIKTTVGLENVIHLPEIESDSFWESYEITENGARIDGRRNIDTVTYLSTVEYTMNGVTGTSYFEEVSGEYVLPTPTAEGYAFVGWYWQDQNGAWLQAESYVWNDAEVENVTFHALWLSQPKIGSYSVSILRSAKATVTMMPQLVGEPASDMTAELTSEAYKFGSKNATVNKNATDDDFPFGKRRNWGTQRM